MPKLLSHKEVHDLAAKMTAEYGLPAPDITESDYSSSISVTVYREVKVTKKSEWFRIKSTTTKSVKMFDLYAQNYEEALLQLERELNKLNPRTVVAEKFREKYAMKEADEAFDEILNDPPVPVV